MGIGQPYRVLDKIIICPEKICFFIIIIFRTFVQKINIYILYYKKHFLIVYIRGGTSPPGTPPRGRHRINRIVNDAISTAKNFYISHNRVRDAIKKYILVNY